MAEAAPTLQPSQVLALLQTPHYVARFATGNRDTSRTYNVIRKIYRIENGQFIELKNWYRCSWCDTIMHVKVAGGTAQLLRHILQHCLQRPQGYVLPERNEHLAARHQNHTVNAQQIPAAFDNSAQVPVVDDNLVQGNVPPPNENADTVTVNAQQVPAPVNSLSTAACRGIIDNDHLASVLARISEIGALYGNISSADFMGILPPENGTW